MIQFEYDDLDGEIRAIIEFPLEDAELTKRQFLRAVKTLVQIVDRYHPVIHRAQHQGVIEFDDSGLALEQLHSALLSFDDALKDLGIDVDEIRETVEADLIIDDADEENDSSLSHISSDVEDDDDDEYI